MDGNVSKGIGLAYLKKALKERDYRSAFIGGAGGAATLLAIYAGHEQFGLMRFLDYLDDMGIPRIIFTGGLDVPARAAMDCFGFDMSFANYTFDEKEITPSPYTNGNGLPDKLSTAEKYMHDVGINLSDCLIVGDAETDIPVMECARLSLASPRAKQGVREAADLWTPSYNELVCNLELI